MTAMLDSFWRALVYCLHPKAIFLSMVPILLLAGLSLILGYFYWDAAIGQLRQWMESYAVVQTMTTWLESMGAGNLKTVLAPVILIIGVTPILVISTLLAVAFFMTPVLVRMVANNRYPGLQVKKGASFLLSIWHSLSTTFLALFALLVSLPLWAVPPLALVLPPLIWGWLTYRVMAFDALAEFASVEERRVLLKRHRFQLLFMGVVAGYLGAAPGFIWASGAMFAAAFVILVPIAIWIYTIVFAFSSLWFSHYCLAALDLLRREVFETDAISIAGNVK